MFVTRTWQGELWTRSLRKPGLFLQARLEMLKISQWSNGISMENPDFHHGKPKKYRTHWIFPTKTTLGYFFLETDGCVVIFVFTGHQSRRFFRGFGKRNGGRWKWIPMSWWRSPGLSVVLVRRLHVYYCYYYHYQYDRHYYYYYYS